MGDVGLEPTLLLRQGLSLLRIPIPAISRKNDPVPDVSVRRIRRLLYAETLSVGLRSHRL